MTDGAKHLQEDTAVGGRVLALVRDEGEAAVVAAHLGSEVDGWGVDVRYLCDDREQAALAADEAIFETDPGIVLFVGSAIAADPASAGDVVIADRVSALERGAGPRKTQRRRTRRADPDLIRHARLACHAGGWRQRLGTEADIAGAVRMGLVATGSHALALWMDAAVDARRRFFSEAVALDPSGWDFVFGYYDDEDMPAMAIMGLVAGDDEDGERESKRACERAAAVAAAVIAGVPRSGLRRDPLDPTPEDGESQHLLSDAELLRHESTQGIVQRPFLNSVRVEAVRGDVAPPRPKKHVAPAVLNAYLDDDGVLPADLSLIIKFHDNRLHFELHSDRDRLPFRQPVGVVELKGEFGSTPKEYRENLKARIRTIAARPERSDIGELENLGNRLYNDLFPPELKQAYAEFRDKGVKSLQITSEEPWIPWELVRPHGLDFPDDDFLCMRFAMTRWLAGTNPKQLFEIDSIASLEAGAVEGEELLPSARLECDYIADLAASRDVVNLTPGCARYEVVKSLLARKDRDIHLWHVAAHGNLGANDPDEAVIVFQDRSWRAGDLAGHLGYGIQRARPLVFFNACLVGQQDFAMTRLAGWPFAWVVQNSCGGFIAPQWSVSSELAAAFSKAFYAAVVGDDETGRRGQTLSEAARVARRAVREENPVDPTWLSYAVYGHPNARVRFGPRAQKAA